MRWTDVIPRRSQRLSSAWTTEISAGLMRERILTCLEAYVKVRRCRKLLKVLTANFEGKSRFELLHLRILQLATGLFIEVFLIDVVKLQLYTVCLEQLGKHPTWDVRVVLVSTLPIHLRSPEGFQSHYG